MNLQVACAWIKFEKLYKLIKNYAEDDTGFVFAEEREMDLKNLFDKIKHIDDLSASLQLRHCILIDKKKDQVDGSIMRMVDWERGHAPGDETKEPGDFNMLTEMLGGNPVAL